MGEFKLYVKSSIYLYWAWFKLNKNKINSGKIRLPEKNDDFYFDGYPRSGNTYTYNLLKFIFPNLRSTSHLHTVAGIKYALKKELKVLIIIRHPKDAVLSFLYTKLNKNDHPSTSDRSNLINELLEEWIEYYSFVYKNSNKICTVQFQEAINSPKKVVTKFEDYLKLENILVDNLEDKIKEYNQKIRLKEFNKEVAYSALPNKDRALFKELNENLFDEDELSLKSITLYENVISSIV